MAYCTRGEAVVYCTRGKWISQVLSTGYNNIIIGVPCYDTATTNFTGPGMRR